ncbi:MAG: hypothetical protein LBR73_03400 [Oscillospiraceae bacterium]|jgi:hypothetical protein|nr:hypothetical protein [Oscillospiraceae bacterium]
MTSADFVKVLKDIFMTILNAPEATATALSSFLGPTLYFIGEVIGKLVEFILSFFQYS